LSYIPSPDGMGCAKPAGDMASQVSMSLVVPCGPAHALVPVDRHPRSLTEFRPASWGGKEKKRNGRGEEASEPASSVWACLRVGVWECGCVCASATLAPLHPGRRECDVPVCNLGQGREFEPRRVERVGSCRFGGDATAALDLPGAASARRRCDCNCCWVPFPATVGGVTCVHCGCRVGGVTDWVGGSHDIGTGRAKRMAKVM
jgi:hypothetical protein